MATGGQQQKRRRWTAGEGGRRRAGHRPVGPPIVRAVIGRTPPAAMAMGDGQRKNNSLCPPLRHGSSGWMTSAADDDDADCRAATHCLSSAIQSDLRWTFMHMLAAHRQSRLFWTAPEAKHALGPLTRQSVVLRCIKKSSVIHLYCPLKSPSSPP